MRKSIIVGSRGSKLALIQAQWVMAQLKQDHPDPDFSLAKISTRGDRYRAIPLDRMPDQGVFVKELEEALLDGRIDLAVHSLKDVPTEIPEGLCLAAVPMRLDPRDVFISRDGELATLAPGSKIGTGSLRRAVQLRAYRPDLEVHGLRGNVDTRLRKVFSAELDGVILSAAALIRLGWQDRIVEYLPLQHFLPAVGQGALTIEARSGDKEITELVSSLNHEPTWRSVLAERTFLRVLGGGCRAPIAAICIESGPVLKVDGMVASADGNSLLWASAEGNSQAPEQVGDRLARKMLEMGAATLIAEARAW